MRGSAGGGVASRGGRPGTRGRLSWWGRRLFASLGDVPAGLRAFVCESLGGPRENLNRDQSASMQRCVDGTGPEAIAKDVPRLARRCAFVEMVARAAQSPKWFVSHWWGEAIPEFVACLEQHAQDYGKDLNGVAVKGGTTEETPYWVCAYANNQWALGDALTADPGQTSFHKAMALAEGTVSVLDPKGVVFTRIWCARRPPPCAARDI